MVDTASLLLSECWAALGGDNDAVGGLIFAESGALASRFAVTDLAAATIGSAALAVAELTRVAHGIRPTARVDRRRASFWFQGSLRPLGWAPAPTWDPIAGDYGGGDGWIRLHTNAPHHRAAAEAVLQRQGDRETIAAAVATWEVTALEAAIVAAGGCAAAMRPLAGWRCHPQGIAVAAEPLVMTTIGEAADIPSWPLPPRRPLAGLRVLDLTRVLAGPIASRFLAGYGADVLRIDPPSWDEPAVAPEIMLGKRSARLDLTSPSDRQAFERLLASADLLLHGYRPGALDRLGYDAARRLQIAPGLIEASLNAYGWSGPWAGRRGFDSLVQMSAGIAEAGMVWAGEARPVPLPVQALDHATGYLMAAAAILGVIRRLETGCGSAARLSLARTALLLSEYLASQQEPFRPEAQADLAPAVENTGWGGARRLLPPAEIDGVPQAWVVPALPLGWAPARWADER